MTPVGKVAEVAKLNKDLLEVVRKHYTLQTNLSATVKSLEKKLTEADIIFLGETHNDLQHQKWNGQIVNALWTKTTQLLIEHQPIGNKEQLSGVNAAIASTAKQWDSKESHTSVYFDKLMKLSSMIPGDFRKIEFPEADIKTELTKATRELVKRGTFFIENYFMQPLAIEEGWGIIDGQIAQILDEAESKKASLDRIDLMFKQAFLRLWVMAAQQTLDRFLIELDAEMIDRNSFMLRSIDDAMNTHEKILLVAGSNHFNPTVTDNQKRLILNPIFAYLDASGRTYTLLIPQAGKSQKMNPSILHIGDADTNEIENHALNLVHQFRDLKETEKLERNFDVSGHSPHFKNYLREIKELKELCLDTIRDVGIQDHKKAQNFYYSTGAICLRVHDLAKAIQLWNVVVELALADPDQKTGLGNPLKW